MKNFNVANLLNISLWCIEGHKLTVKWFKIVTKIFGSLEISRTFALPFEKRVARKAESSYED